MPPRALIDTNIVVYALDPQSEFYGPSAALLGQCQTAESGLCVAPRVLAEFYRVITDPRKVRTAYDSEVALRAIEDLVAQPGLEVLPVPNDLIARWIELVRRRPVKGAKLFDVTLVATMLANDVTRIYTYNRVDFEPFEELEVLQPSPVSQP